MGRALFSTIVLVSGVALSLGGCTFQATIIELPDPIDATCGDDTVDPGETCDGNCPTSPDACPSDDNNCTRSELTGDPARCNVECINVPITECGPLDLCCPSSCPASNNDRDCNPMCGNDVREGDELCDGIDCPTVCIAPPNPGPPAPPPPACQREVLEGSPGNCDVRCVTTMETSCINDDNCCPSGCDGYNDNDCIVCGNSLREPGETCETGNCPRANTCDDKLSCSVHTFAGSFNACTSTCTVTAVGTCTDDDGCCPTGCDPLNDSDCSLYCGDGVVQSPEHCDGDCPRTPYDCDDGNTCTLDKVVGDPENCSSQCAYEAITDCASGDGCCPIGCDAAGDTDCSPTCGNMTTEPPETCDGNCVTVCPQNSCGSVTIPIGGNQVCDVQCLEVERTECADFDGCCSNNCNSTNDNDCPPVCGNGVFEMGEECDDHNNVEGDGCSTSCNIESAGGWSCDISSDPSICTWDCTGGIGMLTFNTPGVYTFKITCPTNTLEVALVGGGGGGAHAADIFGMPATEFGGGGGGGGVSQFKLGSDIVAQAGGGGGGGGGVMGAAGGGGGGGGAVTFNGLTVSSDMQIEVIVGGGGKPGCQEASGNGGVFGGGLGSNLVGACVDGTNAPAGLGGGAGGVAGCGAAGTSSLGGGGGGGGTSELGGGGGADVLHNPGTSVVGLPGEFDCGGSGPCDFGGPGGGGSARVVGAVAVTTVDVMDGDTGEGGLSGGDGGDGGYGANGGFLGMPDGEFPGGGGYGANGMSGTCPSGEGGDGQVIIIMQ